MQHLLTKLAPLQTLSGNDNPNKEMKRWIKKHGSNRLKESLRNNENVDESYKFERFSKQFQLNKATLFEELKAIETPSIQILSLKKEMMNSAFYTNELNAELVLFKRFTSEFSLVEECEAVAIHYKKDIYIHHLKSRS